ncbi:MAG: hypothetical protein ACI9NC_001021 [Verrucomicrobiales bacterium]|jgi:hypothetical protein
MKPKLSLALATLVALVAPASGQIAITEFFANPTGLSDADGEFVELFNFGTESVNLNGWAISDEDTNSDVISETDLFIAPGGYLVLAKNKAALEGAFFNGLSRSEIIEISALTLANGGDEIIITDRDQQVVWSLAYPNGEANGSAAFLTENNFSISVWGTKDSPGIDFTEIDPATRTNQDPDGRLGYQNNSVTTDPNATTENGDTASPLAGFYTSAGGPGSIDDDYRITAIDPSDIIGSYDITFTSENDIIYALEMSTGLSKFATAPSVIVGTGDFTTTTATPQPGASRAFFRIRKTTIVLQR